MNYVIVHVQYSFQICECKMAAELARVVYSSIKPDRLTLQKSERGLYWRVREGLA